VIALHQQRSGVRRVAKHGSRGSGDPGGLWVDYDITLSQQHRRLWVKNSTCRESWISSATPRPLRPSESVVGPSRRRPGRLAATSYSRLIPRSSRSTSRCTVFGRTSESPWSSRALAVFSGAVYINLRRGRRATPLRFQPPCADFGHFSPGVPDSLHIAAYPGVSRETAQNHEASEALELEVFLDLSRCTTNLIAPRRSAVRIRLAPLSEVPACRDLLLSGKPPQSRADCRGSLPIRGDFSSPCQPIELRSAPEHKCPRRRANAPGAGNEARDFDASETYSR
jgi:hypothetical protein